MAKPVPGEFDPEEGCEVLRTEPDRVLAATIYLMSCYARDGGGPRLACIVNRHLELLARCPEAGVLLRETCRRLGATWNAIEAAARKRDAPSGNERALFARIH